MLTTESKKHRITRPLVNSYYKVTFIRLIIFSCALLAISCTFAKQPNKTVNPQGESVIRSQILKLHNMEDHWKYIDVSAVQLRLKPVTAVYRKLLDEHPDDPIFLFGWGYASLTQSTSRHPENRPINVKRFSFNPLVLKSLQRAGDLAPNQAEPKMALALWTVYHGSSSDPNKNWNTAIKGLKEGLKLNPRSAVGYTWLGWAVSQNKKSMAYLTKAISLDPKYPLPYLWLSFACEGLGQYKEASQYLNDYIKLVPIASKDAYIIQYKKRLAPKLKTAGKSSLK